MTPLKKIKHFIDQERLMVHGALLILCTAIVTGLYFLENLDNKLQSQQKFYAEALAQQVGQSAREFVLTGNLISLNVIARQTVQLQPVAHVEFRNATGKVLARAGTANNTALFRRTILLDDHAQAGVVLISLDGHHNRSLRQTLESGFALVTLLLVACWALAVTIWQKLNPNREQARPQASKITSVTPPDSQHGAYLYISIVNFNAYKSRFTPALIEEMLSGYQQLLVQSAAIYNGHIEQVLGKEGRVQFPQPVQEGSFNALCTGMLFLRLARHHSEQRKQQGRTALEFKLMVGYADVGHPHNWQLCTAGVPGRVQIEEQALAAHDLDTRLLYHSNRAVKIQTHTGTITLQPIEQLAQRYHKLLVAQAEKLI